MSEQATCISGTCIFVTYTCVSETYACALVVHTCAYVYGKNACVCSTSRCAALKYTFASAHDQNNDNFTVAAPFHIQKKYHLKMPMVSEMEMDMTTLQLQHILHFLLVKHLFLNMKAQEIFKASQKEELIIIG